MGWLNTILSAANLAAEVAQMNKLEQLRRQGAGSALMQAVLQELRNRIFNYRQAAEEILTTERHDPKRAAGAMKLLELQLRESEITPDLFFDLSDKEYAASTARFIRDNSNRLLAQLPADQQVEINGVTVEAMRLPDYIFYLTHYDDAQRYRAALPDAQRYNVAQTGCGAILVGYLGLVVFLSVGIAVDIALHLGGVGSIASGVAWFIFMRSYTSNRKRYGNAKKIVEELQGQVDLERFNKLGAEFSSDRNRVIELQQRTQAKVNAFFGDGSEPIAISGPVASVISPAPAVAPVIPSVAHASASSSPQPTESNVARFCSNCGAQNTESSKFCMKCGTKLG